MRSFVLLHSYKFCACRSCGAWNISVMVAARGMTFWPPSSSKEMRQSFVPVSRHPRRMISPLSVTSHPCWWKKSAQPASTSSDAATRLFLIPGVLYASFASGGSLLNKSTRFSVVVSTGPFGWMMDFGGVCCRSLVAGAFVLRRDIFAPVSMSAVVFKLSGLTQPGVGIGSTIEQQVCVVSLCLLLYLSLAGL